MCFCFRCICKTSVNISGCALGFSDDINPSSEYELSLQGEAVIPGPPDDAVLNCPVWLPVESHAAFRVVCNRWHLLFGNEDRFST
ncbi:hypothetical protein V6N12_017171 [Hibiscus sabdariffa]|uniref:F-box domain-containing protein n=1 Tax=Hibiscus sabdariffa TaxID=183260 RepID=A0ABR2APN6_9ROSI